jgi:hypothetical protein
MRSEAEIRENLEWLMTQCQNFKDDESERVIRQLETLLWVLGHSRDEAAAMAESVWSNARNHRDQHPRDY